MEKGNYFKHSLWCLSLGFSIILHNMSQCGNIPFHYRFILHCIFIQAQGVRLEELALNTTSFFHYVGPVDVKMKMATTIA